MELPILVRGHYKDTLTRYDIETLFIIIERIISDRAATFTKFGKRLHEFQLPKRFRLHGTSRFDFFIMQIGKIADIFPRKLF